MPFSFPRLYTNSADMCNVPVFLYYTCGLPIGSLKCPDTLFLLMWTCCFPKDTSKVNTCEHFLIQGSLLLCSRRPISCVLSAVSFDISKFLLAEKARATHSSTLAWKIPWMEEPGGLQSMGSLRVGHNWATSLSRFIFMHWRRKWQPTPAFLRGESQGWGSLVGCRLWGRTESDTTKAT